MIAPSAQRPPLAPLPPLATLLRAYGINDLTPPTGELRSTPRWWSSRSHDTHVNTRGATDGSAEVQARRLEHRRRAAIDVAHAFNESLSQCAVHIAPLQREVLVKNFKTCFGDRVTVTVLRRLQDCEAQRFADFSFRALFDVQGDAPHPARDRKHLPTAALSPAARAEVSAADFTEPTTAAATRSETESKQMRLHASMRAHETPQALRAQALERLQAMHAPLLRDPKLASAALRLLKMAQERRPDISADAVVQHPVFSQLARAGQDTRGAEELARHLFAVHMAR